MLRHWRVLLRENVLRYLNTEKQMGREMEAVRVMTNTAIAIANDDDEAGPDFNSSDGPLTKIGEN